MVPIVDLKQLMSLVIRELKNLKGNDRLSINNLRESNELAMGLAKSSNRFTYAGTSYDVAELMHGGGSSSSATNVWGEVVAGSGTTFTLAYAPDSGTVRVYARGQRIAVTSDYTISDATITTVLSWSAGDIVADYEYTP